MKNKRRGITRLVTKVTRAFPILLIIGGMVLSFASQPLPVIGMSSSDRAADAGYFAQADDPTGRAKIDAFWKSGEAAALQAQEGASLTFLDPETDTPVCMPDPVTLEATVQANLPEGVEARLQVNWYVIAPADLRTDIEYIEAGLVTDGDTFTWSAEWPGIRPEDTFVEILFGAALIDPDTNDILATATLDIYWYPWVCPVVGEPTETPVTPTPDTLTPTVTETVLTPDPDTPTPTFTETPVPDTATPTFTSTPTVTETLVTPTPVTPTPTETPLPPTPTVAAPIPDTPTPIVVTATPIVLPGPIITATPIVLIPPPIQATPVVIIPPPIQATPVVIIPPPIQATPQVIIPPPIQATPVVIIPEPIQATPVVIIPEPIQATPQVIIPPPIQATPVVIIPEPIVATPVVVIPEPIQATPIVLAPVVITATPVVVEPPVPVTAEEPPVDKPVIVPTLEVPAVVEPEEFIPVTGADLTHLYAQPAALENADWKIAMNLVMAIAGLVSMLAGVIFLFSPNRQ
jgi:hypothetical protein